MPDDTLLIEALFRVMKELRRDYDARVREMGLTFSRARVLSALARNEGVTQADLAAAIGIEAPSLKRHLDALERDGLVERRGLDGDARKRALFLTARARSGPIPGYVNRLRARLLEGIDPEDQARIRAALERIADNAAGLNKP